MKLSFIFGIIIIFAFLLSGYMHEQVHVAIFKDYNIESHVEYFSHFPAIVTIAEKSCPTSECELAHEINEAIGYQLDAFFIIIAFGLLFIIGAIES